MEKSFIGLFHSIKSSGIRRIEPETSLLGAQLFVSSVQLNHYSILVKKHETFSILNINYKL